MPRPRKGESSRDFISRAIRHLRAEGRPQKQAIAMAFSMLRQARGKRVAPLPKRSRSKSKRIQPRKRDRR